MYLDKRLPRLYLITDRKLCDDIFFVVEEALKNGLRMLQLREKDLNTVELYNLALKMRKLTTLYKALLIINDRVDIATVVGADGVHIGKNSLPVPIVKRLLKGKLIIGYSAHSSSEVLALEDKGVDFFTISPIFTPSNKDYKPRPKGTSVLNSLKQVKIPLYALGGITLSNVSSLKSFYGVSLISEIIASANPGAKTKELIAAL